MTPEQLIKGVRWDHGGENFRKGCAQCALLAEIDEIKAVASRERTELLAERNDARMMAEALRLSLGVATGSPQTIENSVRFPWEEER